MAPQTTPSRTNSPERAGASIVPRGEWRVVREDSNVGFKTRKMGLYDVKGRFREVEGRIEFAPQASGPSGEVTIQARSISTRMPPRDWHLRTKDFLDVKNHPRIHIVVERIEDAGEGGYEVPAEIEIHGERRPVRLSAHAHETDGGDRETVRLHLEGTIDRREFGIRARPPFEQVVGREVQLDVKLLLERVG